MTTIQEAVNAILPLGKSGRSEYPWCNLSGVRFHLWRAYKAPMYIVNVVDLKGRPSTYKKGEEKWLCKYDPDTKFKLWDSGKVEPVDEKKSNGKEKREDYTDMHEPYSDMLLLHLGVNL